MNSKLEISRELALRLNNLHATGNDIDIEMVELRALLAAPAVERQEPFMYGIMQPDGKPHYSELCVSGESSDLESEVESMNDDGDGGYRVVALYAEQPAPVAVAQHQFADKVISKLQRFVECCDDGQGADIGRHWFDILTHLGLLNRVQRSPGLWEMTQQGDDVLDKVKEMNPACND